ncbi:hypothetical protein [Streptomyces sp. NPDC054794]
MLVLDEPTTGLDAMVVDRGGIVETGRHEELLARGGAYCRLHRSQNNAVMETGELRMPLAGYEGHAAAAEVWTRPAYETHGAHGTYEIRETHGAYGVYEAPWHGP